MTKRTLDDVLAERDQLEAAFWKRSDELTDEFEELIEELDEGK